VPRKIRREEEAQEEEVQEEARKINWTFVLDKEEFKKAEGS